MIYGVLVLIICAALWMYLYRKKKTVKETGPTDIVMLPPESNENPKGASEETSEETSEEISYSVTIYKDGKESKGVVKMAQGMQVYGSDGSLWLTVGSRVFKKIGSFTTQFDKSKASQVFGSSRYKFRFTDSRIAGKTIMFFPQKIEYVQTGSNQCYVYPYTIYREGNDIVWFYVAHTTDTENLYTYSIAKITWDYGWF